MSIGIGERVGAILSGSDTEINFLGYGTRIEDEIPISAGGLGEMLVEMKHTNPTILLDSGEKVYGCECWWGSEKAVQKMLEGKKITIVTVSEARNKGE
jgi:hypothetical protein